MQATIEGLELHFERIDCRSYGFTTKFDLILMMDFGMARFHALDEIAYVLYCTFDSLVPGGLFIFEIFTPYNSLEFATQFDSGGPGPFDNSWYRRTDYYEAHSQTHTSVFEMQHGPLPHTETIHWRAWHYNQVRLHLLECLGAIELVIICHCIYQCADAGVAQVYRFRAA